MYKFLTFLSLYVMFSGLGLCMNKYLEGKPYTSVLGTAIMILVCAVLATRLSNIIDRAD